MAKRPKQTLMDYMVIAISPMLIMTLVGSLLFFLLTVFYQGQYEARLTFIFALFVMAIVLIARISMTSGIEYASLFAIPLAVVTGLAMIRFVRLEGVGAAYGMLINFGLMVLVWWSAHKLTWDCTLIDDSQDSSGEGLLQGLGFGGDADDSEQALADDQSFAQESAGPQDAAATNELPTWWQRMVDRRHRPHTPGVWVVYYSIVALGVFGIGQWFIPAANAASRLWAFRLMFVYVFSALGLLLTTSFLGLRRYLRQRHLQMPADMAGMWLGIGSIMILVLLLFCVLLPRPGAELKVSQFPVRFVSPDHHRAHERAWGHDGARQPDQATRSRSDAEKKGASSNSSVDGRQSDSSSQNDRSRESRLEPPPAGSRQRATEARSVPASQAESGDAGHRESADTTPAPADPKTSNDRGSAQSNPKRSRQSESSGSRQRLPQDQSREVGPKLEESRSSSSPGEVAEKKSDTGESKSRAGSAGTSPLSRALGSLAGGFGNLLKLLFWAVLTCLCGYFAWKYRDRVMAAIRQLIGDLKHLLARLLGGQRAREQGSDASTSSATPPRSFASYADPFTNGRAKRYSTEQLIRYSFEALEAWARGRGCPRTEDQTPLEFARGVAVEHPGMGMEVQSLADLYSRVAYGHERIADERCSVLETLWRHMCSTATMPLPPQESA